jgi:hypothetical protein
MQKQATYYFNPQDYTACKELREAYMNETDGDARRAMLALCIDMAALDRANWIMPMPNDAGGRPAA